MNPPLKGRQRLRTLVDRGPHLLLVAAHCVIGDDELQTVALVDTASEWCVLEWSAAATMGFDTTRLQDTLYHTRFGLIRGRIERMAVRLLATEGADVQIEATFFISPDWPGPTVLGWRGGLERVRIALDPFEDWLYFGEAAAAE
jgi:hypothetical protein